MKKRPKKNKHGNNNIKNSSKTDIAIFLIPLRYLILLALMFSLPLIYSLLTPMTISSTAALLKLVYSNVVVYDSTILINSNVLIQIIPACVAGSAYLLLLILNLSVSMNLKKRTCSILVSFLILFLLNLSRIFILAILFVNKFYLFDFTHKVFWYSLSTIFVVLIWFLTVKLFKIKEIPIYSDMRKLIPKKK